MAEDNRNDFEMSPGDSKRPNRALQRTAGRSAARLKDEWSESEMSDIEGKAVRETATERGSEGVSIYEVK